MCEEYHTNLDDFLETKIARKKWDNSKVIMFVFLLVLCIGIVLFFVFHRDDFEFKTLSSNCDNFNLFGSIAYNANKSSIYISNITYCGEEDFTRYQTIHCALYESIDKTTTQISRCDYQKNTLVTLNEFLNSVSIQVDNYDKNCKTYQENSLYLEIEAIYGENQIRIYKIPLQLEGMCEK